MATRLRSAFTLIELLIVVAIIAILAAIAVPNFLEAQARSKVARVQADFRTVATALEAYRVDSNRYPPFEMEPQNYSIPGGGNSRFADPCVRSSGGLTTPISYLSLIPQDPFGKSEEDDLFRIVGSSITYDVYYYNTKEWFDCAGVPFRIFQDDPNENASNPASWVLISKGPDRYYSPPKSLIPDGAEHMFRAGFYRYDPTNGTLSLGNIVRTGP